MGGAYKALYYLFSIITVLIYYAIKRKTRINIPKSAKM